MTSTIPEKHLGQPLTWAVESATAAMEAVLEVVEESGDGTAHVVSSDDHDIKLSLDAQVGVIITSILQKTGLPILSEETIETNPTISSLHGQQWWLIDPLDGSANYARGFPVFSSSIALMYGTTPVVGVVYDFHQRKLYQTLTDAGSYCNGVPLRVSDVSEPGQAFLATGFPSARDYSRESIDRFVERVQIFKKIRMLGSAAVSLLTVASGIFDAYFEEDIWLWDVAAGLVLVKEAGGSFVISLPNDKMQVTAVAWNGRLPIKEIGGVETDNA